MLSIFGCFVKAWCVCGPHTERSDHKTEPTASVYHQYGMVGATAFIIIKAVMPAVAVIVSISLCLYFSQRHSRNKQLLPAFLPYSQLNLSAESSVVFQGMFG
ncbi:hypothetical protein ABBQ38_006304 [Trebouxia sp. C0009 RCD-2024]